MTGITCHYTTQYPVEVCQGHICPAILNIPKAVFWRCAATSHAPVYWVASVNVHYVYMYTVSECRPHISMLANAVLLTYYSITGFATLQVDCHGTYQMLYYLACSFRLSLGFNIFCEHVYKGPTYKNHIL